MISEKNFAGNSSYIFYSLALTDGLHLKHPTYPKKAKDFEANCFDKDSNYFTTA
jgi:hypothetical protein